MRLHSIEISGFKSFPERSALSFDGGVTAIVGPNGCGKSNVIDAISWVLGEQSARSLRGERMEDVIFSGSDARRPTATAEVRIQLSHVTAVLAALGARRVPPGRGGNGLAVSDESTAPDVAEIVVNGDVEPADVNPSEAPQDLARAVDIDLFVPAEVEIDDLADLETDLDDGPVISRDVEVARRLYRSGESEYMIDGRVCRLRDIQDLLMDSGVGVKAYAVIEQGKIGQILGARPMERRQLLEGAAGVTKYKTRRRAAELKLEAAQQNLTRVDDIVFEVEKQRGALKRQAAKARRYRRLREELRQWEKVQFSRKSVALEGAIDAASRRLEETREREHAAAATLAAIENTHAQLQIELAESEHGATRARDAAHAHELEMGRRQQQIEFDQSQVTVLGSTVLEGESELERLEQQRAPLEVELHQQTLASAECETQREAAAATLRTDESDHVESLSAIEGLERDVEACRSEVYAAINAATALQHVVENAVEATAAIADELTRLGAESDDLATAAEKTSLEGERLVSAVAGVRQNLDTIRRARVDREAELDSARQSRDARGDEMRERERELASMAARARSIEELVAAREGYSDAARLVLASSESVVHLGSVADHLDMERDYERAVEANLGELVQYIVVPSIADARAGMMLASSQNAGRCGFVIADRAIESEPETPPVAGLTPLSDLVRVDGAGASGVRALLRRRWLAPSADVSEAAAAVTADPITTADGTVFRSALVVHGGGKEEARGILTTKGEIRELHAKMERETETVKQLEVDMARFADLATRAEAGVKTLQTEEHSAEKELLELELGVTRVNDELAALAQKTGLVETEQRRAEEKRASLDARQAEAREAIARLEIEQRSADERFMVSQRHLLEARERVEALVARVTDAKAGHAALAERAAALTADVIRLGDAARDLDDRLERCRESNRQASAQRQMLEATIVAAKMQLDEDVARFDQLRGEVKTLDERADDVRQRIGDRVDQLRSSRESLEDVRAAIAQLDVQRATAEADLAHLETTCQETLQLTLELVRAEVEQLENDGGLDAIGAVVAVGTDDADPTEDSDRHGPGAEPEKDALNAESDTDAAIDATSPRDGDDDTPQTPEERILTLREKIERLGPVNMMAIDEFDTLEERFDFLTTQRQDLLDSIRSTGDAIRRIDVTTRERFQEAFEAVNDHFQKIFSTLFGGGRAGLLLIDDTDVLESGIDIIAQPPGKRLQSVQLLSGGEKALTAMALMFAIFKFKPSPFCLLDEIDAPLDDANIGRFVEMLRGMQDHTQFVLVTHNRKTMEIADRLYGVTMEEPGVSKLISVDLN